MIGMVGSQPATGYYADWNGNVTGVYSDVPSALDDVLDNSRLADHPAARVLTDGVDDAFQRLTATMGPLTGTDGVDQPRGSLAELKDRRKLEERLFGLDPTCSCSICARPAVGCICGQFADLAPKLKAPPPSVDAGGTGSRRFPAPPPDAATA
jgi:hypothetical protein